MYHHKTILYQFHLLFLKVLICMPGTSIAEEIMVQHVRFKILSMKTMEHEKDIVMIDITKIIFVFRLLQRITSG